jgi:hypothetical protein
METFFADENGFFDDALIFSEDLPVNLNELFSRGKGCHLHRG